MKHARESCISQVELGAETCSDDGCSQLIAWQQSEGGIWRVGSQAGDSALQES